MLQLIVDSLLHAVCECSAFPLHDFDLLLNFKSNRFVLIEAFSSSVSEFSFHCVEEIVVLLGLSVEQHT